MPEELRDFDRSSGLSLETLQDRIVVWTRNLKNLFKADKATQSSPGERTLRNSVHAWAKVECKGAADPILTAADSYNVSAVSRTSAGLYDFTITGYTQNLAVLVSIDDQSTVFILGGGTTGTTNMRAFSNNTSGVATDVTDGVNLHIVAVGY